MRGVIDLGNRQAFNVVAAAREKADDARKHARLVVDENGDGVALVRCLLLHQTPPPGPARPQGAGERARVMCELTAAPFLLPTPRLSLLPRRTGSFRCAPRPRASSDSSSPLDPRARRRSPAAS